MHLHSLQLINVRQFEHRTFEFQPGFNLLVGENGAGKTTILRGLLAAIGDARQMGRRPKLEDSDIRLRTRLAEIRAVVCHSDSQFEEFQIRKELWESATRSTNRGKHPLILLYSSNEALCSAMQPKSSNRTRNFDKDSFRRNEEFLYMSERNFFEHSITQSKRQFGNSQQVRRFVNKVLSTFSPAMSNFHWRFEPYECSLVSSEGVAKKLSVDATAQRQARTFAMRWLDEWSMQRRRPFDWPDQAKIILTPDEPDHERSNRSLPRLRDIWRDIETSSINREFLLSCSLEVKLTPRIMIQRKIGALSLNQLSDGEQRLFSLFVDIARQLLIHNPDDTIGEGKAIVLIDEIDVHLHPKWQRRIVPALEDLFPNCQFIATTHSPFVIQATRRHQINPIDPNFSKMHLDGGNSIEDIVEDIQGIPVPQRSMRAEKLSAAATKYFSLLENIAGNVEQVNSEELRDAERSYREASEPFTSDPAIHALLKVLAKESSNQ